MELGLNIDPQNIRGSIKIKAALTCPICSLMLRSPVMRCEECGNYFCQSCLTSWWSKEGQQGKCIYKCNTSELKVIKREAIFSPMLQLLEFPCQNKGCEQVLTHQTLKKHMQQCDWADVECQYCFITFTKKQMKQHNDLCELKPIPCHHCELQFIRKQIASHEEECPEKVISCSNDGCQQAYSIKDMETHLLFCSYCIIHCEWCKTSLIKKDLDNHNTTCKQRKANCEACHQQILIQQLNNHSSQCDQIKIECKVCYNRFPRKELNSTHTMNQCVISEIKSLRKQNVQLRESNIELKLMMENLQIKYDELSNDNKKYREKIDEPKNTELLVLEKDFQRLDYSLGSLEKLKAEQFSNHMKKPHIFGDWCPICKQIDKKFVKMIEPLETQRKEISDKIRLLKKK